MNIRSLSKLISDCRSDKDRRFSVDSPIFISLVFALCGAEIQSEPARGIPCEDTFNGFFYLPSTL